MTKGRWFGRVLCSISAGKRQQTAKSPESVGGGNPKTSGRARVPTYALRGTNLFKLLEGKKQDSKIKKRREAAARTNLRKTLYHKNAKCQEAKGQNVEDWQTKTCLHPASSSAQEFRPPFRERSIWRCGGALVRHEQWRERSLASCKPRCVGIRCTAGGRRRVP